jgi:3D-(3,5/4)-trihydroxycyclohexane-1,2-dione acylhydrolase (decyclizing)
MLIDALPAAMRVLTSPSETGAVTLALPQDVQAEAWDWPAELLAPRTWTIPRPRPDVGLLARAVELILAAERPMIVSGGGTIYSGAADALDAFATRFGIPVTETQAGKGALHWDHPFNLGAMGSAGGRAGNAIARDADLVIAVGTRLSDFPTMSWTSWQDPDVGFIAINATEFDAAKAAAVPLVADARAALEELHAALNERGFGGAAPERMARIEGLRSEWNTEVERVLHLTSDSDVSQPEVIRLVNEAAGADGVMVAAAGSLPGDLHKTWRAAGPHSYHMEYGYSTMGYEVAGGMGVAMADPDREVYVMLGDGSYLMLANEIATAYQEGISMTVVILDNHGFRCIHNLSGSCGGDNVFNHFRVREAKTGSFTGETLPIDYAANAASLGATVLRADTAAGLEAALAEAKGIKGRPVAIVVEVNPEPAVPDYESWWDVPVAEVSTSQRVREARKEYEASLKKERSFV